MNRLEPLQISLAGTSLIEASAGTGKTYTITTLYLRLLLERDLVASEILVVTYTRAATAELRDRIRRRIAGALQAFQSGDPADDNVFESLLAKFSSADDRKRVTGQLARALADFDEAAILTIHGFCQRVLRENAFESLASFQVELLADQQALLEEIVGDYWSNRISTESELFIRFLMQQRVSVDSMIRLAARASGAAPANIVPDPPLATVEEMLELEERFQASREATLKSWNSCQEEVLAQLRAAAEAKEISNAVYKPDAIATTWGSLLSEELSSLFPALLDRSSIFERFTASKLIEKTNKKKPTPEHAFYTECDALASAYRALVAALQARRIHLERDLISTVEEESALRKERAGQQSYDDLLGQVASALEQSGAELLVGRLRHQFRAALVDEFQDTDQLQYGILRRIWHVQPNQGEDDDKAPTLFLIGDPKQAIYGFRGADVHAYLLAKHDAGERCFTLDTNWRSDPSMVEGVNCLFSQTAEPFRVEGIPFDPIAPKSDGKDRIVAGEVGAPHAGALEVLWVENETGKPFSAGSIKAELPWRVAADIARLIRSDVRIDGERVMPGDIAVLCRTNPETQAMSEALRDVGVPTALLGNASVFDSEDAIEMERLLDAIAEPAAGNIVRAALATRIFGQTADEIAALQDDEAAWDRWLAVFRSLHDVFVERGFIRMSHQLFREERVHARMLALEDGDRRITNLLHLVELLEQAALTNHLGLRALADWLASMRTDRSLRRNVIGEQGELRLESDADAVKIVTVHKSKGLEYPIVYCPFLWGGADLRLDEKKWVRFHDASRDHEIVLDLGSEERAEHEQLASDEAVAESRRLLYVALTRAKHRCSVVWGNIKGVEKSPIAALFHPSLLPAASEAGETGKKKSKPTLAKLTDDELREELERLFTRSNGAVGLRPLPNEPAERIEGVQTSENFERAEVTRTISSSWSHSSFSRLTSHDVSGSHFLPRSGEEGFDYDAVPEPTVLVPVAPSQAEVPLNAFPAGAVAGTLLHSILEHLDFEIPTREQTRDIVRSSLEGSPFDVKWHDELCDALDRMIATPWSKGGPSLSDLGRSKRLDELEFMLPVASRERQSSGERAMRVADLASVFGRHADSDFKRSYASRLEQLRFDPLAGYLRGYVDLVFEWNDRFYVVDYKSNHLGPSPAHYEPSQLERPMSENHYVLQYHLYTVALDRYLSLRLPDYDYERDFGGVYYLFLRGIDPAHPTGCGVYYDRPAHDMIADLTSVLRAPEGAQP